MNSKYRRKSIFMLLSVVFLLMFTASVLAAEKPGKRSGSNCPAVMLTNENFLPALIKSIDEAQTEILMSLFSFKAGKHKNSSPDQIASHLARAVKRGVKVYVVLETSEKPSEELSIQNRKTGNFLQSRGVNVFYDSPRRTTHTKLIVIDQRLVLLGSHNFTQSALKYNNEISVMLNSPDLAANARRYILEIMQERN
ncbi:MAG: phospholipase D-like domain-containing protein [Smithella sp.]